MIIRSTKRDKYPKKLVAILNGKIEIGDAMSALAHMAVGLGASVENKEELRLTDYADADGNSHANISELPFIILRARNSNELRMLRTALIEKGIKYVDFTNAVKLTGTFEDSGKSKDIREADMEYFGIAIFDDWDRVTEITKRFSLWK
ncbi:DUF2000 domain-containing protein [Patescibacteria group bacterium]|nr:DUF2000 domain-containing protein [Patescibacteria group bacterium]